MRTILFVAMQDSPHTAKWISALDPASWEVLLFPVIEGAPMSYLMPKHVTLLKRNKTSWFRKPDDAQELAQIINKLKPEVVHSLEFQHATYLTLEARKFVKRFPLWIASNWGSDIYFYQHLPDHRKKIDQILSLLDALVVECERDKSLARNLGFEKEIFLSINSGGINLEKIAAIRVAATQESLSIIVKGYEHFAGRALSALRAVRLAAKEVPGIRATIFSASLATRKMSNRLGGRGSLALAVTPYLDNDDLLASFATNQAYLGISVSDGLSTSAIEAMALGVFPIQANSSCAGDWITNGVNGFIVDPHNSEEIKNAIIRALQDEELRRDASRLNLEIIRRHFDHEIISRQIQAFYASLPS